MKYKNTIVGIIMQKELTEKENRMFIRGEGG